VTKPEECRKGSRCLGGPQLFVLYCNWTRCTCHWSNVEKSGEFSNNMEHKDCRTIYGWLSECQSRHPIELKSTHCKKDSGHILSAEQWKSRKDGIWNIYETGPFYRATPDGSLSYKHATL